MNYSSEAMATDNQIDGQPSSPSPAPAPDKAGSGFKVVDYLIILASLFVLVLLTANVWAISMARNFNDTCCRRAVEGAADAAIHGKNAQAVMDAAKDALINCNSPFWPLLRPQFTQFKDERGMGYRQLVIQTRSVVRIPAPLLVADEQFRSGAPLLLTSTYVVRFKDAPH
ncbi:MAG TPA: hypothetical protein V6C72_04965 [Chroococcales cyanobacterium]